MAFRRRRPPVLVIVGLVVAVLVIVVLALPGSDSSPDQQSYLDIVRPQLQLSAQQGAVVRDIRANARSLDRLTLVQRVNDLVGAAAGVQRRGGSGRATRIPRIRRQPSQAGDEHAGPGDGVAPRRAPGLVVGGVGRSGSGPSLPGGPAAHRRGRPLRRVPAGVVTITGGVDQRSPVPVGREPRRLGPGRPGSLRPRAEAVAFPGPAPRRRPRAGVHPAFAHVLPGHDRRAGTRPPADGQRGGRQHRQRDRARCTGGRHGDGRCRHSRRAPS